MSLTDLMLQGSEEPVEIINVGVISVGSVNKIEIEEGSTIGDLRKKLNIDKNISIYVDGAILNDSFVIQPDMDIFLGTSKKGG